MKHDTSDPRDPALAPSAGERLKREQRRLRRAFTALVAALSPVIAVQACSPSGPVPVGSGDDSGAANGDANGDADAQTDALPDASGDAAAEGDATEDKSCVAMITAFDANADGEQNCVYTLPCGLPSYLNVIGCEVYTNEDAALDCSVIETATCTMDADVPPAPSGATQIFCYDCLGGGRRSAGIARPRAIAAPSAAGAYFARMAHDEAAAVHAFRRLHEELREHGAPSDLVLATERAARDEVRHARLLARRARALRAPIPAVKQRRRGPRTLEAIARENAVEGCVRETFGALVLRFQAANAPTAELRGTLARIAEDETRHAALARVIAEWADARLTPAARRRVARARSRALLSLRAPVGPSPWDAAVGMPAPAERAALAQAMTWNIPE